MENQNIEGGPNWKPTKKELAIDNNNVPQLTKVTYERESNSHNWFRSFCYDYFL